MSLLYDDSRMALVDILPEEFGNDEDDVGVVVVFAAVAVVFAVVAMVPSMD